jgi:hypothetical protein
MEFTAEERDMLLRALFELRIEHFDQAVPIEALAVKLGGDPDTALFGAYRHSHDDAAPLSDYPADETNEG